MADKTFKLKNLEVVVAAFVAGAAIIAIVLTIFALGHKSLFEKKYHLTALFENVLGLKPGSPIYFMGIQVGLVKDIHVGSMNKVDVVLQIKKGYQIQINLESVARITRITPGVGDRIISIIPGRAMTFYMDGDTIKSEDLFEIEDVVDNITPVLENIMNITANLEIIVRQILSGENTLGAILNDKSLYKQVHQLIYSGNNIAQKGNAIVSTLDTTFLHLEEAAQDIPSLIKTIQRISENLADVLLLARNAVGNIEEISTDLKGVNLPALIESGQESIGEAQKIIESIKKMWLFKRSIPEEKIPEYLMFQAEDQY